MKFGSAQTPPMSVVVQTRYGTDVSRIRAGFCRLAAAATTLGSLIAGPPTLAAPLCDIDPCRLTIDFGAGGLIATDYGLEIRFGEQGVLDLGQGGQLILGTNGAATLDLAQWPMHVATGDVLRLGENGQIIFGPNGRIDTGEEGAITGQSAGQLFIESAGMTTIFSAGQLNLGEITSPEGVVSLSSGERMVTGHELADTLNQELLRVTYRGTAPDSVLRAEAEQVVFVGERIDVSRVTLAVDDVDGAPQPTAGFGSIIGGNQPLCANAGTAAISVVTEPNGTVVLNGHSESLVSGTVLIAQGQLPTPSENPAVWDRLAEPAGRIVTAGDHCSGNVGRTIPLTALPAPILLKFEPATTPLVEASLEDVGSSSAIAPTMSNDASVAADERVVQPAAAGDSSVPPAVATSDAELDTDTASNDSNAPAVSRTEEVSTETAEGGGGALPWWSVVLLMLKRFHVRSKKNAALEDDGAADPGCSLGWSCVGWLVAVIGICRIRAAATSSNRNV